MANLTPEFAQSAARTVIWPHVAARSRSEADISDLCKELDMMSMMSLSEAKDLGVTEVAVDATVTPICDSLSTLNVKSDDIDFPFIKTLLDQRTQLKAQYITIPKGIHSSEAISFYRNTLKANDSVMSILEEGYDPPFATMPCLPMRLPNNRSAREHPQFVRYLLVF